ncbi:MAG: histidine kinase [Actinomycetia bacterium]|nr:histidine kinase [Actinomycetes bacterium]
MHVAEPSTTGVSGWLDGDARRIGGVARWLAHRLGTHRVVARTAFLVAALAGGAGIAAYGLAWMLTAVGEEPRRREPSTRNDVGVVFVVAAVVAAMTSVVPWLPTAMLWLVALAMMGVAIAATPDLDQQGDVALRAAPVRAGIGVVLMVTAAATALAGTQDLNGLWQALLVVIALVTGLSIVVGPWMGTLSAAAERERRERIRAEERADIAAHLHDSVLQTLTLIQNRANESQVVTALAHQQERELRRWLYGSELTDTGDQVTLRSAVERLAAEIEDQYLVAVESIVVGDHPLTPEVLAIVGAAREALVNAAKFSGSNVVSVFADVSDLEISVFVRDRGQGFDPNEVARDRRGISESIIGRIERLGGTASIRSQPGAGTEVTLSIGASAGDTACQASSDGSEEQT